jgi:hypothetical protein
MSCNDQLVIKFEHLLHLHEVPPLKTSSREEEQSRQGVNSVTPYALCKVHKLKSH